MLPICAPIRVWGHWSRGHTPPKEKGLSLSHWPPTNHLELLSGYLQAGIVTSLILCWYCAGNYGCCGLLSTGTTESHPEDSTQSTPLHPPALALFRSPVLCFWALGMWLEVFEKPYPGKVSHLGSCSWLIRYEKDGSLRVRCGGSVL